MATVDERMSRVIGGDELEDDYSHCILPPCNGRQFGRPPSSVRSPKHKAEGVAGVQNVGK